MTNTPPQPATGKLGILLPGLGAVSTTLIAGVELARRGLGRPIGSLTQMATIRLGKRSEGRTPKIKDFVPLAPLTDVVFGAWDPIPDNAYESALKAGVLDKHNHIDPIAEYLRRIEPMPAAFDQRYVKRLQGTNVIPGTSKREWVEALRADIRNFKAKNDCERLVVVWCGSTEVFISVWPVLKSLPAMTTRCFLASSQAAGKSTVRFGAPFAKGTPSESAA